MCDYTYKRKCLRDYVDAYMAHKRAERGLKTATELEKETRSKMYLAFSKLDEKEKQRQAYFDNLFSDDKELDNA